MRGFLLEKNMTWAVITLISTTLLLLTYIITYTNPNTLNKILNTETLTTTPYSAFAITLLVIAIAAFTILLSSETKIDSNIGIIGDFFGGTLNPTYTLITIFILLRVSRIQNIEFKKNTELLEEQRKIIALEKFENTFFKLTEQIERLATDFDKAPNADSKNPEKTESKRLNIERRLDRVTQHANFKNLSKTKQHSTIYKEIKAELRNDFDSNLAFIRTLTLTIEHIEKSKLPNQQKNFYYNIILAGIPISTIYLAAIYSITVKAKRHRRAIKKSTLTKTIRKKLFYTEAISNYYLK